MDSTKKRIVKAFERRLEDVGYDGATLDDIASELHISKKTIYVHFDSKQDIYGELVARQAAEQKIRLAASIATLPTYTERVKAVVRATVEMARAHIAETSKDEWMREYEVAADAFRQATGELMRELIDAGMESDEFACGPVSFLERMVAAMLMDYVLMLREDPSDEYDDELAERIVRFLT